MLTSTESEKICFLLKKYMRIVNKPDESNNIILENNKIKLLKDDNIVLQRNLNVLNLLNYISNFNYPSNIFKSQDCQFSPFEADRNKNKWIWKENYCHINIPTFMPILLFSLLISDSIPSISEFCLIYINTYTEEIPIEELSLERFKLYSRRIINDRTKLGKIYCYNQKPPVIKNKILRFKNSCLKYISGLPINEFTTEQLCYRIHKAYGSIIRDIFTPLLFYEKGVDAYYSWATDLSGIDCILNNVPIFSFTDTKVAKEFRRKKIKIRHKDLVDWGINLKADLAKPIISRKLLLPTEEAIQQVLICLNKSRIYQDEIIDIIY